MTGTVRLWRARLWFGTDITGYTRKIFAVFYRETDHAEVSDMLPKRAQLHSQHPLRATAQGRSPTVLSRSFDVCKTLLVSV